MSFVTKLWKDRVSEYGNRRKLIDSNNNESVVTVQRYEGSVTQEGDAFNATNMNDLESRIADGINSIGNSLASVATSGSYTDLSDKPTIGDAVLTIQRNGTSLGTFTANATSNTTVNVTVPTAVSSLTNDSGYIKGMNVGSVLSNQSWSGDKYTSHTLSWTATQNAWVFLTGYEAAPNAVKVNNTILWNYSSGTDGHHPFGPVFVKSGQTISITSIVQCTLRAFAAS